MNIKDQALLEQLQDTLKKTIEKNGGELLAADVLDASRELDAMVLKFMRLGGDEL